MKTISLRALSPCFLALFLYANTLDYDFSYDDRGIVLENSDIQLLNWSRLLASSYWGESEDGLYRPLTMLSYGVNQFFDGGARYFHAATGNSGAGYFGGGLNIGSVFYSSMNKLTYSTDTTAVVPGAALSGARARLGASSAKANAVAATTNIV